MTEKALRDAFDEALRFSLHSTEAQRIINALHDRGYVINPMGSVMDAQANVSDGPGPYQKTVRARVQMTPDVCGAQFVIDENRAMDERFMSDYVPRYLADQIMRAYAEKIAQPIALALKGGSDD